MVRKVLIGALLLLMLVSISLLQAQQLQPLPLVGRAPVELLTNGGFEIDTDTNKIPDGWDTQNTLLPKSDKIKCDKPGKPVAHTGTCAFMFRGNANGTPSTLSQTVTDVSGITDGMTLQFSAYIDPRSGVPGATFGKVNLKLSDGEQINLNLAIPGDEVRDPADYVEVSKSKILNLSGVSVVKIKVKFLNQAAKGRFVIEDASLTLDDGEITTATFTSTLQSTSTPTLTVTDTLTNIPSATFTWTPSSTSTKIPTNPPTAGPTPTPTITKSMTPSPITPSPTSTQTLTPTDGPSSTPTSTSTAAPCPCKLTASDGAAWNYFGKAVAISGTTMVVGVERSDINGAAYIYVWDGLRWTEQAKLTASNADFPHGFGSKVAIYGDTVIVGASNKDSSRGAAYVFTRNGETWTEQQKLFASDGAAYSHFGSAVAIYGDIAMIGAYGDNTHRGAAYIFTREGNIWTEQQKLISANRKTYQFFGFSIAMTSTTAVIGAYGQSENQTAIYVFTRNGETWIEQQKLIGSNVPDSYYFAADIALNDNHLIVGTYSPNGGQDTVYIFNWNGSKWIEQQKLTVEDDNGDQSFGSSLAITDNMLIVGARGSNNHPGKAYLFAYNDHVWTEQEILTSIDDPNSVSFGSRVALNDMVAIVGVPFDSIVENIYQGSVWVFDLP